MSTMYFAQELFNPDILGNTKESEIDWISKQVKRIPMLSHEETIILARRYRDHNDLAAKEKLITSNMRLVLSMFGKYKNKGLSSAELIQEGNLGLIRAVEKFDPDKGYKFSTYSCWWIMQSFVKALGNKGRMIRLPLHVVEDNYKIRKQFSKLQSEVPAYLSATDMCEILNIPQKKYGDAAEKNVTATQKFDTALANLKEEVGTKVLPIVEKFVNVLTTVIEKFGALPTPIQNVILGITGLVAIGGPMLTFLASAKTAMVTLGLVSGTTTGAIGATTIATNLLRVALAGLGIGLVIAAIVLLVQNWDKVTAAVDKVWETIKDVVPKAWNKVMEFKDKVVGFVGEIIKAYFLIPSKMFEVGQDIVEGLWNGMKNMVNWLKDKVTGLFGGVVDFAKKALGIKSPSKVFAGIGTGGIAMKSHALSPSVASPIPL